MREASAMEKIRTFLYKINRRAPVLVPRVIRDMVTRYSANHLTYSVDNINNVLECLTLLFPESVDNLFIGLGISLSPK